MKHNIFIAQNISKLRPKLEIEKCMVMPEGCAIATNEHPRWDKHSSTGRVSPTNNLGLDIRPNGGLIIISFSSLDGSENWRYGLMGFECILWFDGNFNGEWNVDNAQTVWSGGTWFFGYIGGTGDHGTPRGHQNNALGVRACKDYISIDVPDGTKFYNAYVDGDGNAYDAVKIGDLLWITENLKTTKFQNGTSIQLGENIDDFKYNDDTPLYTFYEYNTRGEYYKDIYGGLYNWYCIKNGLVNGNGWRVPTRQDLGALRNYLINTKWCDDVVVDSNNVSRYVKSCRQVEHPLAEQCEVMPEGCAIATNEHPRWNSNNIYYGTNNFKFDATSGGGRDLNGKFFDFGSRAYWWSSTSIIGGKSYYVNIRPENNIFVTLYEKNGGRCVRAIKNKTGVEYDSLVDGDLIIDDYTDGEGNKYNCVVIGNQIWTTENLKTTKYQNGINIDNIEVDLDWAGLTTGAFCWYNNDYDEYGQYYGVLYNWYAVDNGLVNNNGYRVPSKGDWDELINYISTTNWCDIEIEDNKIAQYLKSCRQVNHPLASNTFVDSQSHRGETPVVAPPPINYFKINETIYQTSEIDYDFKYDYVVGDVITRLLPHTGIRIVSDSQGIIFAENEVADEVGASYTIKSEDLTTPIRVYITSTPI